METVRHKAVQSAPATRLKFHHSLGHYSVPSLVDHDTTFRMTLLVFRIRMDAVPAFSPMLMSIRVNACASAARARNSCEIANSEAASSRKSPARMIRENA